MNKQKIRDIVGWSIVSISSIVIFLFVSGILPVERAAQELPEPVGQETAAPATESSPGQTPGQTPSVSGVDEELPVFEEESIIPTVLSHKPVSEPQIRYDVALTLYDDMRRLHGAMRVYYTNTTPNELYELVFHLHPNAYKRSESPGSQAESRAYPDMKFSSGQTIISSVSLNSKLSYHSLSEDELILRIPFTTPLLPGDEVEALIEFAVDVPELNGRFGFTRLGYQLGNFLPVLAVYQDGAWVEDTYQDKGDPFYSEVADYSVSLKYPDTYTLACTGSITGEDSSGGMKTSAIQAKKARDFSCMLTKDMRVSQENFKGIKILSYALSDSSAATGARFARQALEVYDSLIGEYPYDTFTVAQAELYSAGGVEHTSFIMVQRAQYLSGRELDLQYTISHEVAHQYFYALVGNDQINAPWIDEALATYFSLLPIEADNEASYEQLKKVLFLDRATYVKRMDGGLYDYADASEYSSSVYWRGGAMYDALRQELGDETFFAAVRNYVSAHAYRIAVKQDIINAFEKASGLDLEQFFYEWLGGTQVE